MHRELFSCGRAFVLSMIIIVMIVIELRCVFVASVQASKVPESFERR